MEVDAPAGNPFRAALLRQRLSPDNLPAPGFFRKAAALGQDVTDPGEFVSRHRAALADSPPKACP
jgi:hypothetical protein